jgi:hypothetical protein
MGKSGKFYVVGENIHCTRVYKIGGKYVSETGDGGAVINFADDGVDKQLRIPEKFTKSTSWQSGKVKHTAVAIWQGLYGDDSAGEAAREFIHYMVKRQEARDASFLDVNVDEFSTDPEECKEAMAWAVGMVQEAAGVPLSIDSSNPGTLELGLSAVKKVLGKPMVNSVSLERTDTFQMAKDAGAVVIANAAGEEKLPDTKEERMGNLQRILELLGKTGFNDEEIFIDPLVFPVSVNPSNGTDVLDAIEQMRKTYGPDIHFAPGLSNISYGMPNRKLLNQVFTYLCRERGLDGGIVDPLQINGGILDALDPEDKAFQIARAFLLGEDMFGKEYISAVRGGDI